MVKNGWSASKLAQKGSKRVKTGQNVSKGAVGEVAACTAAQNIMYDSTVGNKVPNPCYVVIQQYMYNMTGFFHPGGADKIACGTDVTVRHISKHGMDKIQTVMVGGRMCRYSGTSNCLVLGLAAGLPGLPKARLRPSGGPASARPGGGLGLTSHLVYATSYTS